MSIVVDYRRLLFIATDCRVLSLKGNFYRSWHCCVFSITIDRGVTHILSVTDS